MSKVFDFVAYTEMRGLKPKKDVEFSEIKFFIEGVAELFNSNIIYLEAESNEEGLVFQVVQYVALWCPDYDFLKIFIDFLQESLKDKGQANKYLIDILVSRAEQQNPEEFDFIHKIRIRLR